MYIKEIPIDERPRERLVKLGVNYLNSYELLAIIFSTGNKFNSVMDISKNVINYLEDNINLDITINELMKIKGIGKAKACQVLALVELSKRILNKKENIVFFKESIEIYNYFKNDLSSLNQECFYCLYLDSKLKLIKKELLFIGTINYTVIHPREIFKWAFKYSAARIILVHNHPSGDPTPSKSDIEATKNIIEASKLVQIEIIDHVIVGKDRFFSFSDNKLI